MRAPSDRFVGRLLDGRYRVRERIASGGMAVVYRAVDTQLERDVAIKVINPELARDQEFLTRFVGEAKVAAALSHPNAVAVYDHRTDAGECYLVMEYVPGLTLRELLNRRGALSPDRAFRVLEAVLPALAVAHGGGLVHRDVKPENILVGTDGRIRIADFGLARLVTAPNQTRTGQLLGTVAYLAPEQIEHGHSDQRTDVYAAGIVLYEMVTGAKPFEGDNPLSVLFQHVHHDVPAPSERVPDLPPELDRLVAEATCRDPNGRPAHAGELLARVGQVRKTLAGGGRRSTRGPVAPAAPVAPASAALRTEAAEPLRPTLRFRRPRPGRTPRSAPPRRSAASAPRGTGVRVLRWLVRPGTLFRAALAVTAGVTGAVVARQDLRSVMGTRNWPLPYADGFRDSLLSPLGDHGLTAAWSAGLALATLWLGTVLGRRRAARASRPLTSDRLLATELRVQFGAFEAEPDSAGQPRVVLPVTVTNKGRTTRAFRFTVRTWTGNGLDPSPTDTVVTRRLRPGESQTLRVFEGLAVLPAAQRDRLVARARKGGFEAIEAVCV